jgi:hypothetical protein
VARGGGETDLASRSTFGALGPASERGASEGGRGVEGGTGRSGPFGFVRSWEEREALVMAWLLSLVAAWVGQVCVAGECTGLLFWFVGVVCRGFLCARGETCWRGVEVRWTLPRTRRWLLWAPRRGAGHRREDARGGNESPVGGKDCVRGVQVFRCSGVQVFRCSAIISSRGVRGRICSVLRGIGCSGRSGLFSLVQVELNGGVFDPFGSVRFCSAVVEGRRWRRWSWRVSLPGLRVVQRSVLREILHRTIVLSEMCQGSRCGGLGVNH